MEPALNLLNVGPQSADNFDTNRFDVSISLSVFLAFARTDFKSSSAYTEAFLLIEAHIASASSTGRPFISGTICLNFLGVILIYLAVALAIIFYVNSVDTSVAAPCFLNVLVGANSPSLWPTIFSVA